MFKFVWCNWINFRHSHVRAVQRLHPMCVQPHSGHRRARAPNTYSTKPPRLSGWLARMRRKNQWQRQMEAIAQHRGDSKLNIILYASSSGGGGALVCVASATTTAVDGSMCVRARVLPRTLAHVWRWCGHSSQYFNWKRARSFHISRTRFGCTRICYSTLLDNSW